MARAKSFPISPGIGLLLSDLGLRPADVLRRAQLPEDLFAHKGASLTTEEYFRFWRALEAEADDPALPIRIVEAISAEMFDPPLFAALCSPNLNVAAARLSVHKRLVAPMRLNVKVTATRTTVSFEWLNAVEAPPDSLAGMELAFIVRLARIGTREHVRPLEASTLVPLHSHRAYEEYLGAPVKVGDFYGLVFSAADATRPFLTANEGMWEVFQPELRRRLAQLDDTATTTDRVRSALLELLPSGDGSLDTVASKLGLSRRTLQRRLKDEGGRFQDVLNRTREELARHYLATTSLPGAEISFLLGFDDPNSFFRAFHDWTGQTPERVRTASQTIQ